jgi:hypothetical protein
MRPFVAGLIERNLIVDSTGYSLQIKHQVERPAACRHPCRTQPDDHPPQRVRQGQLARARSAASERPRRALSSHRPRRRRFLRNLRENFFYQNRKEALFQGEGNVALYANVFVNDFADGLHIQAAQRLPRRIVVAYNTILAKGRGNRRVAPGRQRAFIGAT